MATEAHENHRAVLTTLLRDPFLAARHALRMKKRSAASDDENNGKKTHDDDDKKTRHDDDAANDVSSQVSQVKGDTCFDCRLLLI